MSEFYVIIPARYAASRLPGKLLLDLAGKPVIVHAIERAHQSGAKQVIVATDDDRIRQVAKSAKAAVVMTQSDHQSGTDRIAEATTLLSLADDEIIINVQGDEPDMPPALIKQMADALINHAQISMCTACAPFVDNAAISDPNIVKVVRDKNDMALYFSRAKIANDRDNQAKFAYRRHLGIYGYRAAYVKEFSAAPICELEQTEKLEQLRALYRGDKIYCPDAIQAPGVGIDTQADIDYARAHWHSDYE